MKRAARPSNREMGNAKLGRNSNPSTPMSSKVQLQLLPSIKIIQACKHMRSTVVPPLQQTGLLSPTPSACVPVGNPVLALVAACSHGFLSLCVAAVDSDHPDRAELLGEQEHPGRVLRSSRPAEQSRLQQARDSPTP